MLDKQNKPDNEGSASSASTKPSPKSPKGRASATDQPKTLKPNGEGIKKTPKGKEKDKDKDKDKVDLGKLARRAARKGFDGAVKAGKQEAKESIQKKSEVLKAAKATIKTFEKKLEKKPRTKGVLFSDVAVEGKDSQWWIEVTAKKKKQTSQRKKSAPRRPVGWIATGKSKAKPGPTTWYAATDQRPKHKTLVKKLDTDLEALAQTKSKQSPDIKDIHLFLKTKMTDAEDKVSKEMMHGISIDVDENVFEQAKDDQNQPALLYPYTISPNAKRKKLRISVSKREERYPTGQFVSRRSLKNLWDDCSAKHTTLQAKDGRWETGPEKQERAMMAQKELKRRLSSKKHTVHAILSHEEGYYPRLITNMNTEENYGGHSLQRHVIGSGAAHLMHSKTHLALRAIAGFTGFPDSFPMAQWPSDLNYEMGRSRKSSAFSSTKDSLKAAQTAREELVAKNRKLWIDVRNDLETTAISDRKSHPRFKIPIASAYESLRVNDKMARGRFSPGMTETEKVDQRTREAQARFHDGIIVGATGTSPLFPGDPHARAAISGNSELASDTTLKEIEVRLAYSTKNSAKGWYVNTIYPDG